MRAMAGLAMKQAGSQIYADGIQRMWKGGGDALNFANPVVQAAGLEQIGYGGLEVAGGVAMGAIGGAMMPSTSSSSNSNSGLDSKESAAGDSARNSRQDDYESGVTVYLHKSERDYLNDLGKSVRKTKNNKMGSRK